MAIQTFTSGQVLTAAQVNALQTNDFNQTVSTKTANYTLVAADKGTRVVMNVSSASTVTVNTSLFSAGDSLVIQNIATDPTVVTAGTATVSTAGSLSIPQFGSGTLYFTSASAAIFFPSAGPPASSGLTLITSGSLSSTATTFTNAFSATYNNYKIIISNVASSAANMKSFKLGSATSGYEYTMMNCNNTSAWSFETYTSSIINVSETSTSVNMSTSIEVLSPFLSATTYFSAISAGQASARYMTVGIHNGSTSFTDFTFSAAAGTFTGDVRIYGYANS